MEVVGGEQAGKATVADVEGRYSLGALPTGSYFLRATADGFEASSSSVVLNVDKVVDFGLAPSTGGGSAPEPPVPPGDRWTVSGTATDASTGTPLGGVQIELLDGPNQGRSTTTDLGGRYSLPDLEPGSATIRASLEDYRSTASAIALQADRTLDFALERDTPGRPTGPEVSGRTVDVLSDLPLAGVTVRIEGAGETTSDGSGAFTLSGGASGAAQRLTLASETTVERRTQVRVPGDIPTLTLIPRSLDLHAFDQMFRARGGLHRWVDTPRLVVQRRVLAFTNTSDMQYVATTEMMSEAEANDLVADLVWALPQLTGQVFTDFAGVDIELAAEGEAVTIQRPGTIVVARYAGLGTSLASWGYGRWAWNGAGEVQVGAVMLDDDFDRSTSPYRRSLRAHELGHTLGYDHVSADMSVMNISGKIEPTTFDLDATRIAFKRQPLNLSPDTDPDPITVNRLTSARTLVWSGAR